MAATSTSMFIVLYFVVGGFVVCNLLSNRCNADAEVDALIDFKNQLQDPQNAMENWDPNLVNACTFYNIICDGDNHVTTVNLPLNDLSGPLSPRIADLPNLQYLYLYGNSLTGSLPPSLGNLNNLIALRLFNNKLSGEIPSSLGQLSKLNFLDLSNNQLSGPVPRDGVLSKFGFDSFKGNPDLCGDVVNKGC